MQRCARQGLYPYQLSLIHDVSELICPGAGAAATVRVLPFIHRLGQPLPHLLDAIVVLVTLGQLSGSLNVATSRYDNLPTDACSASLVAPSRPEEPTWPSSANT